MVCSADRHGPKNFCEITIGKKPDLTKLNPYAFFGVSNNSMTVYADVRESISNDRILDQPISYDYVLSL